MGFQIIRLGKGEKGVFGHDQVKQVYKLSFIFSSAKLHNKILI